MTDEQVVRALRDLCERETGVLPTLAACRAVVMGSAQAHGMAVAGVPRSEWAEALFRAQRARLVVGGRVVRAVR
jgi:hypothetical protein